MISPTATTGQTAAMPRPPTINASNVHTRDGRLMRGSGCPGATSRAACQSGSCWGCLLYTSDAADDLLCVDLGGRRIIKKKTKKNTINTIYVYNKQHTIHKYN